MSYNVTLTNGTNLVVVADGTTDQTTSLTLIGKNVTGYGQFLNENFVQLLENFANGTRPSNALRGQLWWDTTNKVLKIFNGSLWKSISGTTSSATQPPGPGIGDLWWDTSTKQLKVYTLTPPWTVIGPAYTATQGQTGVVANSIIDVIDTTHIVVEFWVNNVLVAILSKDASFDTSLDGFATINPGFNLSSNTGIPLGALKYWGDADNAIKLGGQVAANYLRNDIPGTLVGNLTVTSDIGITIGSTSALNISANTSAVNVSSITSGKDLNFSANSGSITVSSNPTMALGVATKNYVDNQISIVGNIALDGNTQITGNITPATSSLYNFGSSGSTFGNIYANNFVGSTFSGTATNALLLSGVNTYARTDVTPIFAVPVIIHNSATPTQLTVGSGNDFSIGVTASPNAVNLTNNNTGKNLTMQVNVGGILTTTLTANATLGGVTVASDPTVALGVATKNYVDALGITTTNYIDGLINNLISTTLPNLVPAGTIIDFAGNAAPTGFLICPLTSTNVSRTTYSTLFAAIGTTWGVGDGSTTFGLPYFPANYASVQANGNVGTSSAGQVIAHAHSIGTGAYNSGGSGYQYPFIYGNTNYPHPPSTSSTGGAANLAAGVRVLKCIKY